MRAACWHGVGDIRVEEAPAPIVLSPRDAIVRVSTTLITGVDLCAAGGLLPLMRAGDVLGRGGVGRIVALGTAIATLREGDRVIVPGSLSCGSCGPCRRGLGSCCDNSSPPEACALSEETLGQPMGGALGAGRLAGGYAGAHAELVRVPLADTTLIPLPPDASGLSDEKAAALAGVLPAAWAGVDGAQARPGDHAAVWGCGPVGLLTIACLKAAGVEHIHAIDRVPERLAMAAALGAVGVDFTRQSVIAALLDATGGAGPHACIDAAGVRADAGWAGGGGAASSGGARAVAAVLGRVKQTILPEFASGPGAIGGAGGAAGAAGAAGVLAEMVRCCRKGGIVAVIGTQPEALDGTPMAAAMSKGLTWRFAAPDPRRCADAVLPRVLDGSLDPSLVITHTLPLEDAARGYAAAGARSDGCICVALKPEWAAGTRGPGAAA